MQPSLSRKINACVLIACIDLLQWDTAMKSRCLLGERVAAGPAFGARCRDVGFGGIQYLARRTGMTPVATVCAAIASGGGFHPPYVRACLHSCLSIIASGWT